MKVKEYHTYRALYCGLCKCTGRCLSCSARFALSYDFVFLALLRMALTGELPEFDRGRCIAHPIKARTYAKSCGSLIFSARAGALLTYYKVLGDSADTRAFGRFACRLVLPFARRAARRAGELSSLAERIEVHLGVLSEMERRRGTSADASAEVFGRLLADVGSYGLSDKQERIAAEVLLRVGKWIYFADALDDYERDIKNGNYNPLAMAYPDDPEGGKETLLFAMHAERARAADALALIRFPDSGTQAILENILFCGLAKQEYKLSKTEKSQ